MSEGANRLFIEGILSADPEIKATGAGLHFAKFTVANSEFDGEKYDSSYFECVAFGELGETIYRKLRKGSSVFITGKLKQYKWTDRTGQGHTKINIVVKECTEVTGVLEAVAFASSLLTDDENSGIRP